MTSVGFYLLLIYVVMVIISRLYEHARLRRFRERWEHDHPGLKWEDWQHVYRRR